MGHSSVTVTRRHHRDSAPRLAAEPRNQPALIKNIRAKVSVAALSHAQVLPASVPIRLSGETNAPMEAMREQDEKLSEEASKKEVLPDELHEMQRSAVITEPDLEQTALFVLQFKHENSRKDGYE